MADVSVGLFVRLEAADGQSEALAEFLRSAKALVAQEPGTIVWYVLRFGPTTFGIFDAFAGEDGRQAHLAGAVAQGLADHPELFGAPPSIEQVDVLASK
ncbi:MAG TPA: antibiotic biosynthesis monooxygenase [Baekduia sp.]|uniref:putative quinol monooxygenase n=1 Tax=Baekduia sp. TaxID=2600305 RepID=UPI002B84E0D3|nr:antibiotic biosynthesis monooxygenase [Baekduia sp.]HMJ37536.1 antibiotic biosynthesis monooxygenase [Baekduia sp.]